MLSDVNMPGRVRNRLHARGALGPPSGDRRRDGHGHGRPAPTRTIAIELGAYGYVLKPFKPNELIINVGNALRRRTLEIENRIHRELLEQTVLARTTALRETIAQLETLRHSSSAACARRRSAGSRGLPSSGTRRRASTSSG